jgi:hypothetical protein
MPCVYEFWPSADMSVPETQSNQGFANRAPPVMYLSTANSGPSTRFYCKIRTYTDLCTNLHCACSACWTLAKPQERAESVLQDCQQSRQPAATLSRCTNSHGQQINILVHAIPVPVVPV